MLSLNSSHHAEERMELATRAPQRDAELRNKNIVEPDRSDSQPVGLLKNQIDGRALFQIDFHLAIPDRELALFTDAIDPHEPPTGNREFDLRIRLWTP